LLNLCAVKIVITRDSPKSLFVLNTIFKMSGWTRWKWF